MDNPLSKEDVTTKSWKIFENLSQALKYEIERQEIHFEEFTCAHCGEVETCEFAFDLYNTSGDCLMEK